jgi:CRP-like cAMP-binding protein/PAS domain-containing protein
MAPNLRVLDRSLAPPPPGPGVSERILRLVRSAPEREAIAAGQVDAVVDPASGAIFLLPGAQKALDDAQARVRSLLALSANWSWAQDENYRFVSHASTAGENSAPCEESILGKPLWDLGCDTEPAIDWDNHRRQLDARATFRDLELRWTSTTGEMRGLSVSGEPTFDGQGQFNGYRGTMREIGHRQWPEAAVPVSRETVPERKREPEAPTPRPRDQFAQRASIANKLLAALPRNDRRALLASLETVELALSQVLYEPGEPIRHVYFPVNCLVSVRTTVKGNHAMEVGLVGPEGMVGMSLALGMRVSSVRAVLLAPGTALRMTAANFRREFGKSLPLQIRLFRYAHEKLAQARQTAACNRFHMLGGRLAGWLLMASDQLGSDAFYFTHTNLADMLGVRREGITEAACGMERQSLIGYRRGNITLLDRQGLEAVSCGCYRMVRDMNERAPAT